jgi:hypothetical protein
MMGVHTSTSEPREVVTFLLRGHNYCMYKLAPERQFRWEVLITAVYEYTVVR